MTTNKQRGRYSPINPVCLGTVVPCPGAVNRPVRSALTGSNSDLIAEASLLWIVDDDLVLDATYGQGAFWTLYPPRRLIAHDIKTDGVDFRNLPEKDDTIDVMVLDPPYRPSHGSESAEHYADAYGLTIAIDTINDVLALYEAGIREAWRVLRPGGRILVKCQDMSYSGRLHLVHLDVLRLILDAGFDFADEFILVGGGGPTRTEHRQDRARRCHSVLWVGMVPV